MLTSEELSEVLAQKPELTDVKLRIKYATFIALIQRGWKGVGSSYSGVLTKNDFVLTLYKSDASAFQLKEKNKYIVPAAITYFNLPNVSWVLERYNRVFASGKLQSIWEFLYDQPDKIDTTESFMKFINEVESIVNLSNLELQSMGNVYHQDVRNGYQYSVYKGNIVDTGLFLSTTDFGAVRTQTVYRIKSSTEQNGDKVFVLQQLEPASQLDTILTMKDFEEHYVKGEIVPLAAKEAQLTGDIELVAVNSTAMSGLPLQLQRLNFSLEKQQIVGEAIRKRFYIAPLLRIADDSLLPKVLELVKLSNEFDLLNRLPQDVEQLDCLLEYARAGYSIYQPLQNDNVSDSRFEFSELLESASYESEQLAMQYNAGTCELLKFLKTFYMSTEIKPGERANYAYLNMLNEHHILTNLCTSMLSDTMTDPSGTLYLHKVYLNFQTQNEIRSFFFEEGMESIFEKTFSECVHVSFDWRAGFGLSCSGYTLVRVPYGYALRNNDNITMGYILRVNDEVLSYGDLSCLGK